MGILTFVLLLLGFPIFSAVACHLADGSDFLSFDVPMTVVAQIISTASTNTRFSQCRFASSLRHSNVAQRISVRLFRWDLADWRIPRQYSLTSLGFAALFGATSGITTAATAAIGTLTYPRRCAGRLQRKLCLGFDNLEGALDNLIPPSIAMIIAGIATSLRLFSCGPPESALPPAVELLRDIHLLSLDQSASAGISRFLGRDPYSRRDDGLGARRDRRPSADHSVFFTMRRLASPAFTLSS